MQLKEHVEDFVVEEVPAVSLSPGPYVVLELTKRDRTTLDVVHELRDAFGTDDIGYAGLKDKRAVTTQYITVPAHLYNNRELENVQVRKAGTTHQAIHTGQLYGNMFTITVRDCPSCMRKDELVNYFGEQRFSYNNATVGEYLIREQFAAAKDAVIDAGGKNAELVMQHDDPTRALQTLPHTLLTLFVHAFQSDLWNRAARRLEEFTGSIPILGYGTRFDQQRVKQACEEILEEESLDRSDFIVDSWPELSQAGDVRERIVTPGDLSVSQRDTRVYELSFFLPKGSYATVAVQQLCDCVDDV